MPLPVILAAMFGKVVIATAGKSAAAKASAAAVDKVSDVRDKRHPGNPPRAVAQPLR